MTVTNKTILCIDIGGTHCSAALVDCLSRTVVEGSYYRGDVNSHGSADEILRDWSKVINHTLSYKSPHRIFGIRVACPGPFDYENGISLMDGMNKYQALLNFNVKNYLAGISQVSTEQIKFYNDATAFLLGEVYYAHLQQKKVVGLTLGTGLGSSLYQDGIVRDLNFGSAPFDQGIAEDYISTRGILSFLKNLNGQVPVANIKELVLSDQLTVERKQAFNFLADQLINFIKRYILPLYPDMVVIGGSIAKAYTYFYEALKEALPLDIRIASFDERNLFLGLTFETE